MEGKPSTQSGAVFDIYLPIVRAECPDSEFEDFLSANNSKCEMPKNATDIVRFLKTWEI